MIDLRNVPISREKIDLVGRLLDDAKNEFNAGRENFDNRTKQIWEAANEQYNKNNAMRFNTKYQSISRQGLMYDALSKALENTSFPSTIVRERVLSSLELLANENSSKLSYLSQMITIGSEVRQTKFNPDSFVSLLDVVPDDYMRLAERVSDCKDMREKSFGKIYADSQKTDSNGVTLSDYAESFQSAINQSIEKAFGQDLDRVSYGAKIPAEIIHELIANCEQLNANVQNKETDVVM